MAKEVANEVQLETAGLAEELLGWANQHLWTFVAFHHLILIQHWEIVSELEVLEQGGLNC
jgi:hypothetical protein